MHHVTLAAAGQSDDRRSVLHPACAKPELLQVWHLDTTKLKDLQTHKYRPDFTERFGTAEDARADCQHFFLLVHRHPLIRHRLHDPTENVHYDRAQTLFQHCADTLNVRSCPTQTASGEKLSTAQTTHRRLD